MIDILFNVSLEGKSSLNFRVFVFDIYVYKCTALTPNFGTKHPVQSEVLDVTCIEM